MFSFLELCPVCQNEIEENVSVAHPSECPSHYFCVDCLLHWTKNSIAVCPIDRTQYEEIKIFNSLQAKLNGESPNRTLKIDRCNEHIGVKGYIQCLKEPAEVSDTEINPNHFIESIICKVCHDNDNEGLLLLCDGCDEAVHTYCLNPPLRCVPSGDYFCSNCNDYQPPTPPELSTYKCQCCELDEHDLEKLVYCQFCDNLAHLGCLKRMKKIKYRHDEWECEECIEKYMIDVRGRVTRSRTNHVDLAQDTIDDVIDRVIQRINFDTDVELQQPRQRRKSRRRKRMKRARRTRRKSPVSKPIDDDEKPSKSSVVISKPNLYLNPDNYEFDIGREKDDRGPAPVVQKKAVDSRKITLPPPCPIRVTVTPSKVQKSGFLDSILKSQTELIRCKSKNSSIINGKLVCTEQAAVKKKPKKVDPFAKLFSF